MIDFDIGQVTTIKLQLEQLYKFASEMNSC